MNGTGLRRFQGTISRDYDLILETLPAYHELQRLLAHRIADRYVAPDIIDVGLGSGVTTRAILDANPRAGILGIDHEPNMVFQARIRLLADIKRGDVAIVCGDVLALFERLPAGCVDVIASAYTLHNSLARYRRRLQTEMLRVLRRGGMFINLDKYAADDREEYTSEITRQILRYDHLRDMGRDDLRQMWIEHEIADQVPERVMWAQQSLHDLKVIGFDEVSMTQRVGQYAIAQAIKSGREAEEHPSPRPFEG
jgi:tRNA (cmo5U34)-methyltransferase